MIPRNRQALVEMAKEEAATALVTFAKANPLYVMGKRIYLNYSKSKELQKKGVQTDRGYALHLVVLRFNI